MSSRVYCNLHTSKSQDDGYDTMPRDVNEAKMLLNEHESGQTLLVGVLCFQDKVKKRRGE